MILRRWGGLRWGASCGANAPPPVIPPMIPDAPKIPSMNELQFGGWVGICSLTLPHKGKMFWCSYFRSFIKSQIFPDLEISSKNLILLVLLGKLKFPWGIVWGTIYGLYKSTQHPPTPPLTSTPHHHKHTTHPTSP